VSNVAFNESALPRNWSLGDGQDRDEEDDRLDVEGLGKERPIERLKQHCQPTGV